MLYFGYWPKKPVSVGHYTSVPGDPRLSIDFTDEHFLSLSFLVEVPVDALEGDAVAHLDLGHALVLQPKPAVLGLLLGVRNVVTGGLHYAPVPGQVPHLGRFDSFFMLLAHDGFEPGLAQLP